MTQIAVCQDIQEYTHLAERWVPESPFPVIAGPALKRYETVLRNEGQVNLPAVVARCWSGTVVSVGSNATHAAAGILARATGREHHRTQLADLFQRLHDDLCAHPVALVGVANTLSGLGDWPGMHHERLGVITGRSLESLTCLIYRTLTVNERRVERDIVIKHPMIDGAETADAVTMEEVKLLTRKPIRNLNVLTHGRECCVLLPDGLVCGRGTSIPPLKSNFSERTRLPSCLRGEGCWRQDLKDEDRIPAHSIDARVVFLQTCSSVAIGNNAHPPSVNVALGLLEGTSVAVIGTIGIHVSHGPSFEEFHSDLESATTLGSALEQLNVRSELVGGAWGRFGLLGDPGLKVHAEAPQRSRYPSPPKMTQNNVDDMDKVLLRQQETLRRLRSLLLLELPIDEKRLSEVDKLVRRGILARGRMRNELIRESQQGIAEIQECAMRRLRDEVHETWWSFFGDTSRAFRQVSTTPLNCPACGEASAIRADLAYQSSAQLRVSTVKCRRCGDLSWSTSPTQEFAMSSEHVVFTPRGQQNQITCQLVNHQKEAADGYVGFSFIAGAFGDLPRGDTRLARVEAGVSRQEVWGFRLAPHVQAAERYAVATSLFDGNYRCSYIFVNVLPEESAVGKN